MDDFTKKRIEKIMNVYIEQKVPKHIRNEIRLNYKIRGNNVTLVEERPAFMSKEWVELTVAQFRLEQNQWKVYWRDSKKKWHFVEDITPADNFETQLLIVDEDKRNMFWS
ncbi:hypothetical protein PCCS19_43400 [Paenibacillus sp. CCS19]|uniref:DUF3024 domain-containing protein n=1 Tax=Paenibacillus sp. CCS19 TaxID=3158387 RepID=UPI00255DD8AF|nr:DUF3024 domain-containing protein [Paenibacillus cellulosilyticus]GMK41284.1 hypothetical protein PCCS19_43400 [Paenibacillus cellulosilyticus]